LFRTILDKEIKLARSHRDLNSDRWIQGPEWVPSMLNSFDQFPYTMGPYTLNIMKFGKKIRIYVKLKQKRTWACCFNEVSNTMKKNRNTEKTDNGKKVYCVLF